jgi:hypothetical protein
MKKYSIFLAIAFCLVFVTGVFAQAQELTLGLSRDWGYGGFNGDIQGTFSMKAQGPANLVNVKFYIDSTLIGEDSEAPFALQFITDNYPTGLHEMKAVGTTSDGAELTSQTITANFVSKSEGTGAAMKMVIPILVIAFGAIAVSAIVPLVSLKRGKKIAPGASRSYTFGGGICPKCHRPFGFQLLSMNMIGGKLTPCPHCGKWSIIRRASLAELQAAERAELAGETSQVIETSDEEKLRKDLDDSKYQDS